MSCPLLSRGCPVTVIHMLARLSARLPTGPVEQRSLPHERGVSRAFLADLAQALLEHDTITTGQLVWGNTGPSDQLLPQASPLCVASLTQASGVSLVETMVHAGVVASESGQPYFGTAQCFVSYGWHETKVVEQVDAVLSCPGHNNIDFFWIDAFAVAQNQATALNQANNRSDVSAFPTVVESCTSTSLYWAPFDAPAPLSRVSGACTRLY